jgi:hypothetical protein
VELLVEPPQHRIHKRQKHKTRKTKTMKRLIEETAAPGDYHAELRLVDQADEGERTPFLSSGRFFLRFRVAEEPVLEIARTVTLTLPLVTDGWELVAAPSLDGPWTVVAFPAAPDTTFTQSGVTYEGTFPLSADRHFYQLRRSSPEQD